MRDKMFILNGKEPVVCDDLLLWGKWFNNPDIRRVARTDINAKIFVSTVFLGIDHQWGRGKPLLFETMVFGGSMDQECRRYSTWDEAERGHQEMVDEVRKSLEVSQ